MASLSLISTTIVLTEEMTVALVPPPEKSRGPRPVAAKEPGDTGEFASMYLPRAPLLRAVRA